MTRNFVLVVASLGVVLVGYVGYLQLTGGSLGPPPPRKGLEALPPQQELSGAALQIGEEIQIPAGGQIVFRMFDERTGRPTDLFKCETWEPAPGSKDEVFVTRPELSLLMPSGMVATISAERGRLTVDRIDRNRMQPRHGWLEGAALITIDRETRADRTPAGDRPQDLILVRSARLEFDLELGDLRAPGRIEMESQDFRVAGTELHLVWNQAGNLLETLTLARGERMTLYGAAGIFESARAAEPDETERDQAEPRDAAALARSSATAASGAPDPSASRAGASRIGSGPARRAPGGTRPPRATTYHCRMSGGIFAEQYRADERLGGLEALEIELLFDVGGGARDYLERRTTTTQPVRDRSERLEVVWSGPLELTPQPTARRAAEPRRRFIARGDEVILSRAQGEARCGRLEYHDETQRIWLAPTIEGRVHFAQAQRLAASARSVYIDRRLGRATMTGPVQLQALRPGGQPGPSIRSEHGAELALQRAPAGTPVNVSEGAAALELVGLETLEHARFLGDVEVNLGEQRLCAQHIYVQFKPTEAADSFEAALDMATASGGVRLFGRDERLDCAELQLGFDLDETCALYPYALEARGAVVIAQGRTRVRGEHVAATLLPADRTGPGATLLLRDVDIRGRAQLNDPENRLAVRGQQIAASFAGENELLEARILGSAAQWAMAYAEPYQVRGARIDLQRAGQRLEIDGPNRVRFTARRGLQGQMRAAETPVVVTSQRRLTIDGRGNVVRFEGQARAHSGDDSLLADVLTLVLEDTPAATEPAAPTRPSRWQDLQRSAGRFQTAWNEHMRSAGGAPPVADERPARSLALRSAPSEGLRKEPVRLIAERALVQSDSRDPATGRPIVESSIEAPRFDADLVARRITTVGETTLLLTSRAGLDQSDPSRGTLGLPSGLITRGPSQTALRCTRAMTYVLGPDGPRRRDAVLFEGDVRMVHRAGRDMVNLETMLPELARDPQRRAQLPGRTAALVSDRLECEFVADDVGPGGLARGAPRLVWMQASGNVYLRDREDAAIREVTSERMTFDRERSLVIVKGSPSNEAVVSYENPQTGQVDRHVAEDCVVDLNTNTIRTGPVRGEIRRN